MDLEVIRGEQLERDLVFTKGSEALPTDVEDVEVVLESYDLGQDPPVILTAGKGLIQKDENTIRIDALIDPAKFIVGIGRWHVKVILENDQEERVPKFPIRGRLKVGKP